MEVEIVVVLARAWRGKARSEYRVAHVAGIRVPEPVWSDDVAGADDLSFGELPGYRLGEKVITLRAEQWPIRPCHHDTRQARPKHQCRTGKDAASLAAFAEDGADANLFVVLEAHDLSAHIGGISAPQQGMGALIIFSGAQVRDHIVRASLRPPSFHEAGSKLAQIIGSFGRDRRARRALGC
jgi:hypothetical protein